MVENPEIIQTAAQQTATIQITVAREEIQKVMGPGLVELSEAVAEQGIAVTGPWFTHHFRRPTDIFDFEICLPVETPVTAAGRVRPGEIPGVNVARTIYQGGYGGLGAAWGEFQKWIRENGHRPAPDFWERYLSGPDSNPDPATYRTELNQPLLT